MNPYQQAIDVLLKVADANDAAAMVYEAGGDHAQGALARITAASCRAAITRLGGEPNAGRDYTWDDIDSYSESIDHAAGVQRFFLTMKDGSFKKVQILPCETEEQTRAAVLQALKQPVP